MKASPQFKEAVREELRRQVRRSREAAGSDRDAALKDGIDGRRSLIDAHRNLGYALTSMQSWGRASNNLTVKTGAKKLGKLVDQLRAIDSQIERIFVDARRQK